MTTTHNILLIDQDTSQIQKLTGPLLNAGYHVRSAVGSEEALQSIQKLKIDLIVCDIKLIGHDGFKLHEQVHRDYPNIPLIIVVNQALLPEAIEATARGAFGFITPPFEQTHLLDTVKAALETARVRQDQRWRAELLGNSPMMEHLLDQARLVATSDTSIVICGPTGSGKKLLAESIHFASPRSEGPFEVLSCSALPPQLLETELFGFRHTAFSGSKTDRIGLLQKTNGGTLVLDEISDLPRPLQSKLLKILQAGSMKSLDGQGQVPVNVRIIATSSRNLEHTMLSGDFNDALYYHLSQVTLDVPALHDRPEDIPLIARHFLHQAARVSNRRVRNLSAGAIHLLAQAAWPGNVNQLREVIEQVVSQSPSAVVPENLVEQALADQERIIPSFNDARADFERRYLIKLLKITEGNVTHAARIAQRNRTDLYKLLGKYELEPSKFKVSRSRRRSPRTTAMKPEMGRSGTLG